jgi:uracil-DNA glycosylase
MSVGAARGKELTGQGGVPVVASYHPSALLRAPDPAASAHLRKALLSDLKRAWKDAAGRSPR